MKTLLISLLLILPVASAGCFSPVRKAPPTPKAAPTLTLKDLNVLCGTFFPNSEENKRRCVNAALLEMMSQ